ncbi:MAG: hypothetical protein ABSG03_23390 [Bryobacteraceae bacterium]|jgi:hypothetical protein
MATGKLGEMRLICGLLMPCGPVDSTTARARSLTVSWLRWGYFGAVIEADRIDVILRRAAESGQDYCLIQSAGHIIGEQSSIYGGRSRSFFEALADWTARNEFTALGSGGRCFLVNLKRPWQHGHATVDFPGELAGFFIDLGPDLTRQPDFLQRLAWLSEQGARGVFVLNFESYRDIEVPPTSFHGPVSVLYSVGAGLKPNRILQTHGFDARTRVVYFDYSTQALEFRRLLRAEWDGRRYPDFLRSVFQKMPAPGTHYFLWPGANPDNLDWVEMDRLWATEVARWGGQDQIAAHWSRYRELDHEFLLCNILTGHDELLEHIGDQRGSVIWWSNAFCTIFSACHYTLEEKQELYESWIRKLASKAPGILLYGSDHSNSPVNCLGAAEYWKSYQEAGGDSLGERRLYRHAMRF